MSLEFILQLAYSTCHNCLSSGLIDRDSDSFLSTPWTYEDGWKLLLHNTYYATSSTTQNTLTCLSKLPCSLIRYLPLVRSVPHGHASLSKRLECRREFQTKIL